MKNLKKNLPDQAKDKELWFFDESRFGTHSKIGHGWFKTGIRTPLRIKLGFKNFYLYSAVNPKTGQEFTIALPKVNTDCMNIFLEEFALFYQEKFTIIMDGAAWHKSKNLKIPPNIEVIYLPPYCPELNPVERLWQHTKDKTIKNKLHSDIDKLEEIVCGFIKGLTPDTIKSVCRASYMEL